MTGPDNAARAWVDSETKLAEAPGDHSSELHLWLRLLTCTTLIESEVRRRLREEFDFTLPRFDLLAQLEKAKDGLVLGEISRRMMVSAGNITALVERLVEDGYITRAPSPSDKRVQIIKLTSRGHREFAKMAARHGEWIGGLFSGLGEKDAEMLMTCLARLKTSVRAHFADAPAQPPRKPARRRAR